METRDRLRTFIHKNISILDEDLVLGDGDNIFRLGFVDSLFAMKLVGFIERDFGVELHDDDLNLANFSTVDSMAALVEKRSRS